MRMPRTMSLVVLMMALGCGPRPTSTPMAPSPSPTPVPPPSPPPAHLVLNGYVYDTAFRPVGGATVRLLDGAQAGTSAQSNETGRFSFTGIFADPTTMGVSKDGYAAASGTAKSNNSPSGAIWAFVVLDELARPVDIAGDYSLTIVVDSACTGIPSEVRTRTYAASIRPTPDSHTQPGTSLTLTVDSGSVRPDRSSFAIGVAGDEVAFSIYNGEDFGLVEKIATGTFLAIGGTARVSIGTGPVTTISTPFSGDVDYCVFQSDTGWTYQCNSGPRAAYEHCEATHHQLTMSRR
jgi:Carboxypeptidase regulatory-like domain